MTKGNLKYQWSLWGTFEIPKLNFLKTELAYDTTVNELNGIVILTDILRLLSNL